MSGNVATLAGGAAGAFIGSFFGMPGLGFSIGSGLAGMAFAPKPKGNSVDPGDLSFDTSAYGKFQPWGYGTYLVQGPVTFWSTDYVAHKKTEKVGGKGGGAGKQKVETITYTRSFAVYLADCTNGTPIGGVRRIWDAISGQMLYDVGEGADPATLIASQSMAKSIRIYTGALDQQPDPLIEAHEGWAPGHRGHAYIVFEDWDHGGSKQAPVLSIEIVTVSAPTEVVKLPTITAPIYFSEAPDYVRLDNGVLIASHLVNLSSNATSEFPDGKNYLYDLNGGYRGSANFTYPQGYERAYPGITPELKPQSSYFQGYLGTAPVWYLTYSSASVTRNAVLFAGESLLATAKTTSELIGDGIDVLRGAALTPDGQYLYVFLYNSASGHRYDVYDTDRAVIQSVSISLDVGAWNKAVRGQSSGVAIEVDRQHLWYIKNSSDFSGLYRIEADGSFTLLNQLANPSGSNYYSTVADSGLLYVLSREHVDIYRRAPLYNAATVSLADLITDLCGRTELDATDYDVSLLPAQSVRLSIDRLRPARDWLTELGNIYRFRMRNSGGKLQFVPKGGSPVATIEQASLGLDVGEAIRPPITASRTQGIDLPRSVTVVYSDADNDYAPGQQQYVMRQYSQGQDIRLTVTAVLTGAEALELAQIAAKEPHLERLSWTTSVGIEHLSLEAGDVVDLPTGRAWVRDIQEQGDSVLRATFVAEAAAAYSGNGLPAPATTAPVRRIALAGPTRLELLDIPILQDADDGPGVYLAALGYLAGWQGAEVYRSDDGEVFDPLASVVTAAVVGTTTAALATGPVNIWDRANTLNVKLIDGSLNSASELNVLNGANAALVGAHGRWEIIQFETATLEADGSYTLSKLLRGRKGTEWAVGTHQAGDTFVLLTTNTLGRVDKSVNDIGVTRNYKAVSFGNDIAQATTIEFANQGVGLKPYAPAHVTGSRNGTGDLTVKWIRRTRIGGEWRDYVDASLGEDPESYEVDVMNGSIVVRTLAVTSPTATYTGSQQTTDFGSTQSSITLRVYQLSADIGRGYQTEKTL